MRERGKLTSPENSEPNRPPQQVNPPDLLGLAPAVSERNPEQLTLPLGSVVKWRMPGIQRMASKGTIKINQRVTIETFKR